MASSIIKVIIQDTIQKVWEVVTSLYNYQWRSDIERIEIINDKQFFEYTKKGFPTKFTITNVETYKKWEFDMDNKNMRGHWSGTFTDLNGKTLIEFKEEVVAKKLIMKPFVKGYLKKQQKQYVNDLKKSLGAIKLNNNIKI